MAAIGRRALLPLLAVVVLASLALGGTSSAAPGAPAQALAQVNGTGSTYVGLAMQQWTAEAQTQGLQVNYTPTGSPDGLGRFKGGLVDFAGTEAEFSSLQVGGDVPRGFQYVPDVAGAVAVMYNVRDVAGRKVDYLHLSRSTVAKIFMGEITTWADPQIAADNSPVNLKLPDEPINVVYRAGQSGTTALFYDFVKEMEPGIFGQWAARNRLPTNVRIIQLDSSPNFAPKTQALNGSDQIAQFTASEAGLWSIAYDEFGYAKVYRASTAWIQNQSGRWVQPYAVNISAALDSAQLRPDLSQELSGVYRSPNELAYPISAYSYIVTQCLNPGDRPTCRGKYANDGVTNTLARWLSYIACDGQIRMAQIGYSPLPPNLSQEIANSVGRMTGQAPKQLNAGNCSNPRFRGSLGAGAQSPPDPYLNLPGGGGGGGGRGGAGGGGAGGGDAGDGSGGGGLEGLAGLDGLDASGGGTDALAATTGGSTAAAAGVAGAGVDAVGGGSGRSRPAAPVAYLGEPTSGSNLPLLVLLAVIVLPAVVVSVARRVRA